LARTRGARGAVLPPLESALTIRRSNIVDDRDVTNRSTLISVMQIKARALAETGRRDEALQLLEESFASVSQLPEGNSRVSRRIDGLYIKAQVLTDMGRKEDARAAANEETRLLNAFVAANAARKKNGKALNEEGNELYKQASNQTDAEKSRAFDRAAEKYRAALANRPGDRIIWDNLRSTCTRAAEPLTDATGDALTADAATKQHAESELRCALESAWLAWVLSDDGTGSSRADSLKTLYEERRSLARLLRNDDDHLAEARALAEQGVREAEELHAIGQTAETLSLVADSYFGLAMMREESHSEGWEEMMRVAILGGERVREKEPTVARHMTWLGQVRTELAARLDAWKRPGAAEQRKLALQMCQNALRNAKTDSDRTPARACLDALQN
jgi:tetratricopeptide (TPR) repeat protein